ncbi:MAG: F0F1 ATP synthase subunit delta [Roseovarius sp.]|nr:F0F1 ATP synthase subunit delta [Roseovarius sp.]
MTLDLWGLGLQAINVLILVWLLSRVFWRPVAGAIARRQATIKAMVETAETTQAKADAALAEVTQARAGINAERGAALDAAKAEAEAATKATLAEARSKADAMLAAAKITIERDSEAARKANELHASDLSLRIAARLLARMNGPVVQSAFLSQLVEAIANMHEAERSALVDDPAGIEVISAAEIDRAQPEIETAIQTALGGSARLRFVTDPDLIAGLELRSPHFVLHNSWQADLTEIRKAMQNAA